MSSNHNVFIVNCDYEAQKQTRRGANKFLAPDFDNLKICFKIGIKLVYNNQI